MQAVSDCQQAELEIIDKLSGRFSVKRLCRIANVSRSTYYRYKNKQNNKEQ